VSQPYLNADFNMMFAGGIDQIVDTISAAMAAGVIKKEGTAYTHNGERIAIGHDATIEALRSDPVVYESVREEISKKIQELKGTVLRPVTADAVLDKKPRKK
jgi:ribosomal protein L27